MNTIMIMLSLLSEIPKETTMTKRTVLQRKAITRRRFLVLCIISLMCEPITAMENTTGGMRRLTTADTDDGNALCDFYTAVTNKAPLANWCGSKGADGN